MHPDGAQIERSENLDNHTEQGALPSIQLADRAQIRLLLIALVLVCGLFGYEIAHYLISTNLGAGDHAEAWAAVHPQCKELGSPLELSCPFPGYNSVRLQCLATNCGARDPSFPEATERVRAENLAMYRSDSIASLTVEAPFSRNKPGWQVWAQDLRTPSKEAPPRRVDMTKAPQRIEDAWRIVEERSLAISQQTAQEYLNQHAK